MESLISRAQSYRTELLDLSRVTRYEWGAFKLDWDGETATTHWRWSDYNVGAPEPKFRRRDIGHYEVAPDSWVRLRWHGRFRDYDGGQWWYQQTVVNIARYDGELSVDFAGTPGRSFEWLPNLR